jgi:hypothetical protein
LLDAAARSLKATSTLGAQAASLSSTYFSGIEARVKQNFSSVMGAAGSITVGTDTQLASRAMVEDSASVREIAGDNDATASWLWDKVLELGAGLEGDFDVPAPGTYQVSPSTIEVAGPDCSPVGVVKASGFRRRPAPPARLSAGRYGTVAVRVVNQWL